MRIDIIGAGLAGCEAALYLAKRGVPVTLYEQKPHTFSPAHHSAGFAELVCSNSLKAERLDSASGLLKAEMELLGSSLLPAARACSVPAGGALAVDRDEFSARVTQLVEGQPGITVRRGEVKALPAPGQGITLVASGPLTQGAAGGGHRGRHRRRRTFLLRCGGAIVTAQSLDMTKVFAASRYGRGTADYLNCPFDKAGYEAFYEALVSAERAPLHEFDGEPGVYEGCMPIEVMARRGADTMRYGPLRPVGLTNPATGRRPWPTCSCARKTPRVRCIIWWDFRRT